MTVGSDAQAVPSARREERAPVQVERDGSRAVR
jgi:hypothetical protein